MNKHFRFSGSTFAKLEELGVRPLRSCAGPGFPRAMSVSRAYSSRPRSCLPCGARSAKSAPIPRSASSSARKRRSNGSTPSVSLLSRPRTLARHKPDGALQAAHLSGRDRPDRRTTTSGASSFAGFSPTKSSRRFSSSVVFAWVLSIGRHGYWNAGSAAPRGVRAASLSPENPGASFWLSGGLRSHSQRYRLSRYRRCEPFRYAQCRAAGNAGASI